MGCSYDIQNVAFVKFHIVDQARGLHNPKCFGYVQQQIDINLVNHCQLDSDLNPGPLNCKIATLRQHGTNLQRRVFNLVVYRHLYIFRLYHHISSE